VSGRVISSTGRPIARAVVTLTEQNGTPRIALSNGFGFYYFDNVLTGQSITVNAGRKGYTFTPQMVMLNNAATIDLTGTGTP
jgi:anaerobic selenocysteine-containing dehydrogenase